MKIYFYFNGHAVTSLQQKLAEAYITKLLKEISYEMHQQIVSNNDELIIQLIFVETHSDNTKLDMNQFRAYYVCKPFIFASSSQTEFCPLRMDGKITAEQQIELTVIAAPQHEIKHDIFDSVSPYAPTPYIVDVICRNAATPGQRKKLNTLHTVEDSYLHRLPGELIPFIARSLIPYYEITSICTPVMQHFTKIIDTEVQRLMEKNDDFANKKAEALTQAKGRALKAASISTEFFSLKTFYAYKEGEAESLNEVAKTQPHPEWDKAEKGIFRGHGLWSTETSTAPQTMTEIQFDMTERELYFMLDGDWEDHLVYASGKLNETHRLKI